VLRPKTCRHAPSPFERGRKRLECVVRCVVAANMLSFKTLKLSFLNTFWICWSVPQVLLWYRQTQIHSPGTGLRRQRSETLEHVQHVRTPSNAASLNTGFLSCTNMRMRSRGVDRLLTASKRNTLSNMTPYQLPWTQMLGSIPRERNLTFVQ
jgi:hypothetical protein